MPADPISRNNASRSSSDTGLYGLLVFVLLSFLMVIAACHLLETTAYLTGLVDIHRKLMVPPAEISSNSIGMLLYLLYRTLLSLVILVLIYLCFSNHKLARMTLVGVLGIDILTWILHSLYQIILSENNLEQSRILIEVVVIFPEAGLIWLFTHPQVICHLENT